MATMQYIIYCNSAKSIDIKQNCNNIIAVMALFRALQNCNIAMKGEITMTIGDNIRKARGRIKQSELADMLNVDVSTVSRWENGKNVPSGETLQRIAAALNTTGSYLLGQTDTPSADISRPTQEQIQQALSLVQRISSNEATLTEPSMTGTSESMITIRDDNTRQTFSFPSNEEGLKAFMAFLNHSAGFRTSDIHPV